MSEAELLLLWGKTCREKDDPEAYFLRYHPLLFHLLDVGHCALELWEAVLSKRTRERIAKALGCDVETAKCTVAFLAAVHDLGKASPGFQLQPSSLIWIREKLEGAGLNCPAKPENKPHNFISTIELRRLWHTKTIEWRVDGNTGKVLSHITGAHHGTFPISSDYAPYMKTDNVVGEASWQAARLQLFNVVKTNLGSVECEFPQSLPWNDLGTVPLLAGLISVADWLGSSQHFPVAGHREHTMPLSEYIPLSQNQAREALGEFGWVKTPSPKLPRDSFQEFWKFPPNALQKVIIQQAENLTKPFLCIAEAPMGIGKTEMALWGTDAALSAQINTGFYVALPTQATSNAMHRRVKDFLSQRLSDQGTLHLQLVHANASLSDDVKVLWKGLSEIFDENAPTGEKAEVVALSWFCGPKRPLLAPFGVGTIDQCLMATLQTKHWFVRLFGLAGKVVIFDEVHAYDTYMSHLLVTLLAWLKELDCSVILLSATLPSSKRKELLKAWDAVEPDEKVDYPRVTWSSAGQTQLIPVSPKDLRLQTVVISKLHPDRLVATLREQLEHGGCAAIICNTVKEAQDLFQKLREELGDFVDDDNWILFHARLPFAWRKRIEEKILHKFGKVKADRPGNSKRAITVSTQVLEQSLDVDFDWMASYPAPSDLWLQRLGRLHRHAKDENDAAIVRPQGLEIPQFVLLSEINDEEDGPPFFGASQKVYEREILLRSWWLWRNQKTLELPQEIEPLIEATYEQELEELDEEWRKALEDARAERLEAEKKSLQAAGNAVITSKGPEGQIEPHYFVDDEKPLDLIEEDDPRVSQAMRASTREGLPSITAICLREVDGRYYLPSNDGTPNLDAEIFLDQEPERDTVHQLMNFALPLSQPGLYGDLVAQGAPASWAKVPMLRHARVLAFADDGVLVGNTRLRLDGRLGVVIEKL